MIVLGDSLHDSEGIELIDHEDLVQIGKLQIHSNWIWLTGNHDPSIPDQLGGTVVNRFQSHGVIFRHRAEGRYSAFEIVGHLYPVAKISRKGRQLQRRGLFPAEIAWLYRPLAAI